MRPERTHNTGFIRRHCGSVATEALKDRATGVERHFLKQLPPVHLPGNVVRSNPPAGQAFPSGMGLLRVFNI